jgi:hypothetical protein
LEAARGDGGCAPPAQPRSRSGKCGTLRNAIQHWIPQAPRPLWEVRDSAKSKLDPTGASLAFRGAPHPCAHDPRAVLPQPHGLAGGVTPLVGFDKRASRFQSSSCCRCGLHDMSGARILSGRFFTLGLLERMPVYSPSQSPSWQLETARENTRFLTPPSQSSCSRSLGAGTGGGGQIGVPCGKV